MTLVLCGGGKPILEIIQSYKSRVVTVYTHPGNNELMEYCFENRILATTESINDRPPLIKPTHIASLYYKTIIKQPVIAGVNGKIFNAHTALLPRHRGRSSIPWAIIEGDSHTGVTYHYIDKGIDTGRIILQATCQISRDETQASLFDKVNALVVQMFPAAFRLVLGGWAGVEQTGLANYNSDAPPNGGEIDPFWPIDKIERFIRAMIYPPLPPAKYQGFEIRTLDEYEKCNYRYAY